MLEPVIARVPVRTPRLERLGRVEPAAAPAGAGGALSSPAVPQFLDTLDIVLATTLQALFNVIKR